MKKNKKICIRTIIVLFLTVLVLLIAGGGHEIEKTLYPLKYREYVEEFAAQYEMDPLLAYAIIRTESGFDPQATSGVEARGLMQITEETFHWIKSKIAKDENLSFDDVYDPYINIRFGVYYFSRCLERYDNHVDTAAAAYHSGWGTVDKLLNDSKYSDDGKTLHTFPFEQMGKYVQKIDRAYIKYQKYYSNTENEV